MGQCSRKGPAGGGDTGTGTAQRLLLKPQVRIYGLCPRGAQGQSLPREFVLSTRILPQIFSPWVEAMTRHRPVAWLQG